MRWFAVGGALVVVSILALGGAFWRAREASPDAPGPNAQATPAFGRIVTFGTPLPSPDCDVSDAQPSDLTLVTHAVDGVEIGLPTGIELMSSSPEGGSYAAVAPDRTYAVTVLSGAHEYLVGPSLSSELAAIAAGRNVPTPRPATSLEDIVRKRAAQSLSGCNTTLSLPKAQAALFGIRLMHPVYDAFVQLDNGRLVIVTIEDRRPNAPLEELDSDVLAIVSSIRPSDGGDR